MLLIMAGLVVVGLGLGLGFLLGGSAHAAEATPAESTVSKPAKKPKSKDQVKKPTTKAKPGVSKKPTRTADPKAASTVPPTAPATAAPSVGSSLSPSGQSSAIPTAPPAAPTTAAPSGAGAATFDAPITTPRPVQSRTFQAAEAPAPASRRFQQSPESRLAAARAGGESYVGGFIGWNWPSSSGVEYNGTPAPSVSNPTPSPLNPGTTGNDLALKNSFVIGGKLGHFFESMPWLGIETELFNTTPHQKQQTISRMEPGVGTTSGFANGYTMRVLTWAPFNVIVRYPGERLQPYAGVGLGLFFAHRKDAASGDTQSSTVPGLNTQLGLRYKLDEHYSLFGEYKYNYARFSFSEQPNIFGTDLTYHAHIIAFGASFSF